MTNVRSDYDPEDIENEFSGDSDTGDTDSFDIDNARSHYIEPDKSRFHSVKEVDLGPKYSGTAIGRDAIEPASPSDSGDSKTSDDPFGTRLAESSGSSNDSRGSSLERGDRNSNTNANASVNATHKVGSARDRTSDTPASTAGQVEDGLDSENDNITVFQKTPRGENHLSRRTIDKGEERAVFQNIAQQHAEVFRQNLSDAIQADARKGQAVNTQRSSFNFLLSARMGLQKGLTAANSLHMPTIENVSSTARNDYRDNIQAAEQAAESLFEKITALQAAFSLPPTRTRGIKRSFDVYAHQPLDASFESLQRSNLELGLTRRSVVNRWAQKTAPTSSQAGTDRLRVRAVQQLMADSLDTELASSSLNRLISRSRMPRSCAPLHAKDHGIEDNNIYDDADWYTLLLRELVEGKTDSSRSDKHDRDLPTVARVNAMRRENKVHRVDVDVKASKGRKLKFTIQEKIQNFLAPDDRTTWGDKQITELFGSLMGHRIRGGLDERKGMKEDAGKVDHDAEANALRLFEAQ